jgi:hypothetical protein
MKMTEVDPEDPFAYAEWRLIAGKGLRAAVPCSVLGTGIRVYPCSLIGTGSCLGVRVFKDEHGS